LILYVNIYNMAWVCGRPLAAIEVSNPAGAEMVIGFECFVCQRSLRRADHSSRGVLPSIYVPLWSGI